MVKLIGLDKLRTAIFISGTGSNLKNLIDFSYSKKSMIDIKLIFSDNTQAKGLKYAKKNNIKFKIYNFNYKSKAENKILNYLKKNKINLICLAGFMKILSKNFIKKFDGKIINIHPSLLPKYKGLNTHERVLENNEKFTGATVHIVNTKLDSGKIIIQKKIKVYRNDDKKSLKKKVLKIEHLIYPKAIEILSTSF